MGNNQKSIYYIVRTSKETQLCEGRTLIGAVVVLRTPLATFWDPTLEICLAAHADLGGEKLPPSKKNCAIDPARCLATPTYQVCYLIPSELGEISISQKKVFFCENLSTPGELALKVSVKQLAKCQLFWSKKLTFAMVSFSANIRS